MDEIDKKILAILSENARETVKEISKKVLLTSPAVSERIRKLEQTGVIEGYTLRLSQHQNHKTIQAIISISVSPAQREEFLHLLNKLDETRECMQVTGPLSHMVRVCCKDIERLETIISRLQKFGQTNTQIILSMFEKNQTVFE